MTCPDCDKKKLEKYQQLIEKVKTDATKYAKDNGLKKMVIVQTVNGQPAYREPGDESLTRLRTIEIMLFD